jgi:hypothetical protein
MYIHVTSPYCEIPGSADMTAVCVCVQYNKHNKKKLHKTVLENLTARSANKQKSWQFIKPEGSLPLSQKYARGRTLGPINITHTTHYYFLNIHFNIIVPSKSTASKWPLCRNFSKQNFVCYFHARYMPRPSRHP